MLRRTFLGERGAMLVLLVLGVLLGAARAQKETVLYNFCSQTECGDGQSPYAGSGLRPEGKPVWDDPVGRSQQQLRHRMRRRIQTHSKGQGDSALQLLRADRLRRSGTNPSQGWSSTRREICMAPPRAAGDRTTDATRAHAASYSSSLPKANIQSSTASVRRPTAPMGTIPLQGSSSTRRGTCMGRPPAAGPTTTPTAPTNRDAVSYSSSLPRASTQSSTASVLRTQLRRRRESQSRAGLRPKGKPLWDGLRRGT